MHTLQLDADVKKLQKKLTELGFPVGNMARMGWIASPTPSGAVRRYTFRRGQALIG